MRLTRGKRCECVDVCAIVIFILYLNVPDTFSRETF